ncbi:MAG: hypothetical protein FJ118_05470 [Deltaproteobacteria bacterium]|nr:hypothetical protein [Deltaproteobacteria bacterium]
MDPLGLVVRDEETFLTRVVNLGMEQGIFTRDRADEIIRISVAMANKYVLDKQVDFRSTEELAGVQETILKLVGVGLEMKAGGDPDTGVHLLMDASPVDLFRLAYTRVEKLRHQWQSLLRDHRVQIYVSPQEYECLSDICVHRLTDMSIFTETELAAIRSLTLEDQLFSSLGALEYYEAELERYQLILRMRELLPFQLLRRSPLVRAENLSELDSIREAFINTALISAFVEASDPVTVSMASVRAFLKVLAGVDATDVIPEDVETVVVDLIHELAEGLSDREGELLTREVVRIAQKLMDTIFSEWDTVNSSSENVFFKRWRRLVILSDAPDPIERILVSGEKLDEFDFDLLFSHLAALPPEDAISLIERLPWQRLEPDQTIRLFQEFPEYHTKLANRADLTEFVAAEIVDLLEVLTHESLKESLSVLREAVARVQFTLEDLELIADLPHKEASALLIRCLPPGDQDPEQILREFIEASEKTRRALLLSGCGSKWFPDLFTEAWESAPDLVKRIMKPLSAQDAAMFLDAASGNQKPQIVGSKTKGSSLRFKSKSVNALFRSLTQARRNSILKVFVEKG